ncbi:acyl-CoA N-acyltransferase [Pleomassaria siparia CBS 279.74]|uniref:Acyl-CoA N-acyltransferase n=1 Tax=Pleomassaria siparia CBS 279.74 TaxID=1314801 RepID=A0A6G1JVN9_9PLEO|nr:acyl-CoA N-acyltransferase [Pleomassaria siparia CBS 279.74]
MSVTVEQHSQGWPSHFVKIKSQLETCLEEVSYISIEHVGSTSVLSLAAKLTIDITIIIATRQNVQPAINALVAKGFTYMGELGSVGRHALRHPDQFPARYICVGVEGAFQTRNQLVVQDKLQIDPELGDELAQVELGFAAREIDIVEYVEPKKETFQNILDKAGIISEEGCGAIQAANKRGERIGPTQTKRLVLRECVMGDVSAWHALESNEEVVRYQDYGPKTMDQCKRDIVLNIHNSSEIPRKVFELVVTHDGEFIGRIGAKFTSETTTTGGVTAAKGEVPESPHASLWFSFLPASQGKGFATEAMRAFIPLLTSPARLEIECDPRNTRSRMMAERLGFEKISLTERAYESKGEWVGSLVYQKTV